MESLRSILDPPVRPQIVVLHAMYLTVYITCTEPFEACHSKSFGCETRMGLGLCFSMRFYTIQVEVVTPHPLRIQVIFL
jgi:hypothetical protein